jgi:glycosyltransferase involved in cell wall biosynthesis
MKMSAHLPVISVCIPTYNGKEHLADCINSIRSQTFTDFEAVLCDDHSSDGTLEFARQLAGGDRRFRFIANPRRLGLVANWNNCVNQARGEWVKFVFQDDTIAPFCLETLLATCLRYGKPFGFGERDFIFAEDSPEILRNSFIDHKRRLLNDYFEGSSISPERAIRIAASDPTHNLVGEPTVTLIKKSVFREVGGFDEALIQLCDAEFWSRAMIRYGAAFVPETLASFRVHSKAATALNHGERAYRAAVLDPLVIWHRFAFGAKFKLMRDPKISGRSGLSLRVGCASLAGLAWRQAGRTPTAALSGSSGGGLAEWKAVKSHCAGLQVLAWLGVVINGCRRVRAKFSRKAL